jgi:hypothetical protein
MYIYPQQKMVCIDLYNSLLILICATTAQQTEFNLLCICCVNVVERVAHDRCIVLNINSIDCIFCCVMCCAEITTATLRATVRWMNDVHRIIRLFLQGEYLLYSTLLFRPCILKGYVLQYWLTSRLSVAVAHR